MPDELVYEWTIPHEGGATSVSVSSVKGRDSVYLDLHLSGGEMFALQSNVQVALDPIRAREVAEKLQEAADAVWEA